MQQLKLHSNVLNTYFDPNFKPHIPVPVESKSINNDDPTMLGYSVIKEIQSIDIDEIGFGQLLMSTSDTVAGIVAFSQDNQSSSSKLYSSPVQWSKKDLETITYIESLYAMGVINSKNKDIETNIAKITELKTSISLKAEKLKISIPKVQKVIDEHAHSPDMKIQMRVKLLQQFYTFQVLRLKTIEQHLDASEKTLSNASNFISFTLGSLSYNLQAKLLNMDFSTVRDVFHNSIMKKIDDLKKSHETWKEHSKLLYGPFFAFAVFGIICLVTPAKNLIFLMGVLFWLSCIAVIITICIDLYQYENGYDEEKSKKSKTSYFLKSSFMMSFIGLLSVDIFILGMKLITVPLVFVPVGLIGIAAVYGLTQGKSKDPVDDFRDLIFQFHEIENQYKQFLGDPIRERTSKHRLYKH